MPCSSLVTCDGVTCDGVVHCDSVVTPDGVVHCDSSVPRDSVVTCHRRRPYPGPVAAPHLYAGRVPL